MDVDEDWLLESVMTGRATGWKAGSWHNRQEYLSEWHDDEGSHLVCGVADSSPNITETAEQ